MTNTAELVEQEEIQQVEDSQRDLYLTLHLHGEDYGIAISYVTEIIGIQKITNIPDMPDFIKGVVNLRGRVIPVMDVRLCFGLPERDYDERTCIIVVEVDEQTTGLVVDRVDEVVEISAKQIESVPQQKAENNYIKGLGKVGADIKILLDVESLVGFVKTVSNDLDQTGIESED
ncbi:MAG: chemotaxis protein CheW [Desulfuromusa sp.]|nr:chemotaxis protein CheW [Desulfuromusa sp.]